MTAPAADRRRPDRSSPADHEVLRPLDALLFAPTGWFAIDAANRKVPGVTPATLDQALALVGRGAVASVVGQLHPDVAGVDIDAAGALGDTAAEALRDWCAARGLWHLLRPSGGGPGHWHLLVVPGVHRGDLAVLLDRLRREMRLTGKQLDLRTHLRPLSAPHRTGRSFTPAHCLADALTGLQAVLEPVPERVRARRAGQPSPARTRAAGGPEQPLSPLPRPRRELPPSWAGYLARGRRAAAELDRDPATRSQLELEATTALVLAGYAEPDAWAAITAAHRSAFTKARERGRRWWWHVWNRCVLDADAWLTARRAAAPSRAAPRPATEQARAALEQAWRTWPMATRHVDREVLTVVLHRMDRVGAEAVAVPQRDLVLDCAVASRTTVRAALARLQATGWLEVVPTYRPGTTDTAHTLRLPERFTGRPGAGSDSGVVSPAGPSRFQPPLRAPALPLRRALGLPACAAYTYLPGPAAEAGLTVSQLAEVAGLRQQGQSALTARQQRTVRGYLQVLAGHGLAVVDEHGHWRLDPTATDVVANTLERAGRSLDAAVRQRIDHERADFREAIDPARRRARWERQRQAALARQAKAARTRQKAWWDSLALDERERRRTTRSAGFTTLPPADQARHKQQFAERRARAGDSETQRYQRWLDELTPDDLAQRSSHRADAFARRPQHEQQQLVAAWAQHRTRWQLPHHQRTPAPPVRPHAGPGLPEAALLRRQPPTVDELVLFDVATRLPPTAPAKAG